MSARKPLRMVDDLVEISEHEQTIEEAVEHLAPAFIGCRDYGHSWRPWRTAWSEAERAYSSELRCTRCRTIRVRLIGRTGSIIGSHYIYPDGYQMKGVGHLSASDRDVIRLASMVALSTARAKKVETA